MIYSIFNNGTRTYDYYDDGRPSTATHQSPPGRLGPTSLGATPEEAAYRLPSGATKVGSGSLARGRIASLGGFTDMFSWPPSPGMLIAAGVAYLAWRHFR